MKDHDAMDRLLRRQRHVLEHEAPDGPCLDAETIAAWSSGTLPAGLRSAVQSHAATCRRCLGIVAALAQTEPVQAPKTWAAWLRAPWLVPVTAAATALALWVMVDRPFEPDAVPGRQAQERPSAEPIQAPGEPGPAASAVPAVPEGRGADAAPDAGADSFRVDPPPVPAKPLRSESRAREVEENTDRRAQSAPGDRDMLAETVTLAPAPPLPSSPAAAAPTGEAQAEAFRADTRLLLDKAPVQILSPDPAVRWRVTRNAIERSADGGLTWHGQRVVIPGPLLAGSAPSPSVCWVAGGSGTLLRTVDGETWAPVPFPEPIDLVAVTATDGQTAAVTTGDGRTFRTTDGGQTWSLQETPAAPF